MENKKQTAFSKFISSIKELSKNERGKAILFFCGYFIFFFFLIILVRIAKPGNPLGLSSDKYELGTKYNYITSGIRNNNYHFKYTITLDNNIYLYEGDKKDKKESFIFTNNGISTNYFRNDDIFYTNKETKEVVENPYILEYFLDFTNISNIIDKATYISKTDYDSGKDSYDAEISTTTLIKLIERKDIDIDDLPNKINLTTDEKKYLNTITFDLSSYTKYTNLSNSLGTIKLEYTNFDKIESIDN